MLNLNMVIVLPEVGQMKNFHLLLGVVLLALPVAAQTNGTGIRMQSTVCAFEDGKRISVRYAQTSGSAKLNTGQLWPDTSRPMFLFSQATLRIGDSAIPIGAYRLYVIPGKKEWTLVVNKNVASDAKYDQQQDLVRASMETGQVSGDNKKLRIYFGRDAPKQCEFRFYYGNAGAAVEFNEE